MFSAATGNPTDAAGSLSLNLVPAFLLPKLPTYSECTPSDPPPPFQLVSNLQPPNSEQDRSHRSRVVPEPRTPRITRLETPPPNYESVNHSKLARKGQDWPHSVFKDKLLLWRIFSKSLCFHSYIFQILIQRYHIILCNFFIQYCRVQSIVFIVIWNENCFFYYILNIHVANFSEFD